MTNNQPNFQLKPLTQEISQVMASLVPARVAYLDRVLSAVDLNQDDFAPVMMGSTIAELAPSDWEGPFVCIIDGQYISRSEWHTKVHPGEIVVFHRVPQGGGGGSNPLRILLTVAVLWASTYVPGLLGFAKGSLAFNLTSAAILFVGQLAINALVPLPKPPGMADIGAGSPTYSIALQGNQARPEQPIPVGYGQLLTFPDFAAQPYVAFADNEYFYHAVFSVGHTGGRGAYEILRVAIDDTPIQAFSDVQVQTIGACIDADLATPTSAGALVDVSMVTSPEVSGQEMRDLNPVGPFSACKSGAQISKVHIDVTFPRGLGTIGDDGSISDRSVSWIVRARKINDADQPIEDWQDLATETLTRNTSTAQQVSYTYNLPTPGRYQVSVQRTTTFSDNGRHLNDLSWAGLRATLTEPGIVTDGVAYVAVKIRASKQLSGQSQRKVNVLFKRHLPVWNGTTWTTQATRNPAWALVDIWLNPVYGRGLPLSRIDLPTVLSLAQLWNDRQDRFDYVFDSKTTVFEAAQTAARAGRSVPLIRRGRYTLVRDGEQTAPVCLFSPRNMEKDSLSIDYALPTEDEADAVRIRYRDGRYWDERRLMGMEWNGQVYVWEESTELRPAGLPEPSKIVEVNLPGIIGVNHAKREAAYLIAVSAYRRATVSFTAEKEGLLPAYGSLVAVSHDVMAWGLGHAEVVGYDPVTRTMDLSSPMDWSTDASASRVVRIQTPSGDVTAAIAVTRGDNDAQIILASDLDFDPVFNDAEREPTKLAFGTVDNAVEMIRLKNIKPQNDGSVQLVGVVESPDVHAADNQWLPVPGETQDPVSEGEVFDPGLVNDELSGYTISIPPYGNASLIYYWADGFAGVKFFADGSLSLTSQGGNTSIGSWISPRPLPEGVAGGFSIRATLAPTFNSTATYGGAALNEWYPLSSDVEFRAEGRNVQTGYDTENYTPIYTYEPSNVRWVIEIRRNDTFEVLASRTVEFRSESYATYQQRYGA